MFTGMENPSEKMTSTSTATMENLLLQIFERKRWIVDQVKQQIDLYDQHLASKCILDGVTPPPWLWSPSFPSQTSDLNKEEIISGLLFPHSRTSNIYSSNRRYSYQQPVNYFVDNVKSLELNQPLEKQLLEEDEQHDLSPKNLKDGEGVSYSAYEQDPNIASARDFQEEIIPESASVHCKENLSGLFPDNLQNNTVEKNGVAISLDVISPGYSHKGRVPKGDSTTGCEQESRNTSPRYCLQEAEPDTCLDPALSLVRIQRSKSRQRAFELRSSAKASKSRSGNKSDLKASSAENLGFEIASLRSDNVEEIELFEHDENDKGGCRKAVEKSISQGKEGNCFFTTPKSTSPCQKVDSATKSSSMDKHASVAPDSGGPNSLFETGLVNEMALSQPTKTANEVSTNEERKVIDSQSKRCSDIVDLQGSKSLTEEFSSKNEKTKLSISCSGELLPRGSNASPRTGQEIELPQSTSTNYEASAQREAGMSNSQSQELYSGRVTRSRSTAQGCRSKTEHLGNADSSSVDLESRHSVFPQCDDETKLLKPTTVSGEGLVVEDNVKDKGLEEKGIDTSIISRSKSLSLTDILVDERTEMGDIQDCKIKSEHLGNVESSSVEMQSRHTVSVLQHGHTKESSELTTANEKGLLVEVDYTGDKPCKEKGESTHTSRTSTSRVLDETDISLHEPAVVGESVQQENGVVPGHLIEHSTPFDVSCGFKVTQPYSLWTKAEIRQPHGTVSRSRSPSRQKELAEEYEAPSISFEHASEQLDVGAVNSPLNTVHNLPANVKHEPLHFDDNEEQNFYRTQINLHNESDNGAFLIPAAEEKDIDVASSTGLEVNLLVENNLSAIVEHDGIQQERIPVRESLMGDAELKAGESEPSEANNGLSVNNISNVCIDALEKSLKRRLSLSVPNHLSDNSAELQAPEITSLCEMSKEPLVSSLSNLSVNEEKKISFEEDICQLDVFKHALSTSSKRSEEKTNTEDHEVELKVKLSVGELNQSGSSDIQAPETTIQALSQSSPIIESSNLVNKRRRTLDSLCLGMPSSASLGDDIDPGTIGEKLGTVDHGVECFSHYDVELQKMIGSASSTELRLDEAYLLNEAGLKSPATVTFKAEHLNQQVSQAIPNHGVESENTDIVPCARETTHLLDSRVVRDSISTPHVLPIGLVSSDDRSLPELEGFIIQTDDENQAGSRDQINLDSLQLPKSTVERASVLEQICWSACRSTPSLHLSTSFKFDGKPNLNQSVPNRLLSTKDDESKKLEDGADFVNLGIEHAFHERSYSDCLPVSGAGSSTESRKILASPIGKSWYRSMQKSTSSEKRGSLSPDLPCITEENENVDESTDKLWSENTPKSSSSEKQGCSSPDLPCIAEENENSDEAFEALREATYSAMKNESAERKPLVNVDANIEFSAAVSEAKMLVDRQSLDSVNTAFSFTSTCNSVKSKMGKQNGGKRRFTGKGKENRGISRGTTAVRNIDSLRSSKPKLSGYSSLTIQGPRLSEKEPRHNNIVSNITSFIPLVQQPKPASELITGKRDVKVKALEAAEAAKRLAEMKDNERKMKMEALKLERARQEQENQKKQELEKQKKEERKRKEAEMAERKRQKEEEDKRLKEEERKKKEAEMAERRRQREEEKKLKEEERKRKEAEMAERKRQREEEEKKLKDAKRKRMAVTHMQHPKLLAEKGEKESKAQVTDVSTKPQKELIEETGNTVKAVKEQANSSASTKSNVSEDSKSMSSKMISNSGEVSNGTNYTTETIEESYDISPYKCSDDEDEDENEDEIVRNTKFVPAWASKNCVLLSVSSQQNVDPEKIFPSKSFCSIGEVLLPRRLQSR